VIFEVTLRANKPTSAPEPSTRQQVVLVHSSAPPPCVPLNLVATFRKVFCANLDCKTPAFRPTRSPHFPCPALRRKFSALRAPTQPARCQRLPQKMAQAATMQNRAMTNLRSLGLSFLVCEIQFWCCSPACGHVNEAAAGSSDGEPPLSGRRSLRIPLPSRKPELTLAHEKAKLGT